MSERQKRSIDELEFKDNFMFAAVMLDEENAKGVLERILDMEIAHVEISEEKTIVFHPEYKGIRLDVYLKDDRGTCFNVEMQVERTETALRSRYYHSMVDWEILESGKEYKELPDVYVIFICDYDPLKLGKYKYTIRKTLKEDNSFEYDDRSHTVFLSTVGTNEGEESPSLVHFLKYVGGKLSEEESDDFVERLQKSVAKVKSDRSMRERYMLLEEIRKKEFEDGVAEGVAQGEIKSILTLLGRLGVISDGLTTRIQTIKNPELLSQLVLEAAGANSIAEFEKKLNALNC